MDFFLHDHQSALLFSVNGNLIFLMNVNKRRQFFYSITAYKTVTTSQT